MLRQLKSLPATREPSQLDVAWVAGFFEGEGNMLVPTQKNRTARCDITQKDRWVLEKVQNLFGGQIVSHYNKQYPATTYYRWQCFGPNARAFLSLIYPFLSPRRQEKIDRVLAGRQDYIIGPYVVPPRNPITGKFAKNGGKI